MVLRSGSRGSAVVAVQEALKAHGFRVSLDGVFGPNTEAAVRQFQSSAGLTVDGIVGPNTFDRLLSGPGARYRGALRLQRDQGVPEGVTGLAHRVLTIALQDVGKKEAPPGSNRGPEIKHLVDGYADYWSIPNRPYLAWCAMAVMVWTGRALGLGTNARDMEWRKHPIGGKFFGGVAQIATWAEREGLSRPPGDAQPGDIFTMSRAGSGSDAAGATRAGHTGLVLSNDGVNLVTIDGNVSNSVGLRTRPISSLETTIRWHERS